MQYVRKMKQGKEAGEAGLCEELVCEGIARRMTQRTMGMSKWKETYLLCDLGISDKASVAGREQVK